MLWLQGYFYIVTNADGATNYKVMRTPVTALGKEHWEEVLPYDDTVHVEDLDMFAVGDGCAVETGVVAALTLFRVAGWL